MKSNIKNKISSEYEFSAMEFRKTINSLSKADLNKKSHNPGWTNGEILFHMLLGFIVVYVLLPLVLFFGNSPKSWSRIFAGILNLGTPIFNFINASGAKAGGRLLTNKSLEEKFDWVTGKLINKFKSLKPDDWNKGMHFPEKWDGLFDKYMTIADLSSYPVKHFRFHQKQLKK